MFNVRECVQQMLREVGIDIEYDHVGGWDSTRLTIAAAFAVQTALAMTPERPRPVEMPKFLYQFRTIKAKARKQSTKKRK
ncbi:MAG: hypothetical protein V3S55_15145 [Nitrospiraceae bacterium]